ncbi:hypothetical protein RBSH_02720 [Rhodopirellula baltica SH28]|uniref:Uncharacterized protein n=2 Tax=Rhodopirellula baltica TaxID=265606 RepID=K5DGJ7_RHOBT|nr:hypothetical protein RBSH_02720 [Rhodopirellula baltica SH28]ELP34131.1 hypothetical protein RBSWK_01924 [Rhodopirellula baltica SWK14]
MLHRLSEGIATRSRWAPMKERIEVQTKKLLSRTNLRIEASVISRMKMMSQAE